MSARSITLTSLVLGLMLAVTPVFAQEEGRTPPRLSFVDGEVSFYRPGAPDWTQARINIPLAPGDALYTGSPGNFELQIGARAFVRGWADTHLGLENHELDFLQFKVTSGYAAFDLRELPAGTTVEVDTPNAAFTIDRPGYYRADVDGERTTFITRRGGSAVATPVGGASFTITPSEEVVLSGTSNPAVSSYAAPPPDVWDQWNADRTSDLIDTASSRYIAPESYGTDDLDRHGTWRVVPAYGSVWIPAGVPVGWAPYSDGTWILDPYYGWTWVDRAPWGWAPYHYGRWVHVHGYWAWAPGPLVMRPVYAPALVAFVGGPGLHVGVSFGSGPAIGWVALGWGEPCVPWWGRPGFIRRPWWGGWGGPHVVNDVVVHHSHVIHVEHIHQYHHLKHGRGVMAVHEAHFGRGPIRPMHVQRIDSGSLKMHHTVSRRHAAPAGLAPFEKAHRNPPHDTLNRPVVATRRPHAQAASEQRLVRRPQERQTRTAAPSHLVAPPRKRQENDVLKRPAFGQGEHERPSRPRTSSAPPTLERHTFQAEPQPRMPAGRPAETSPGGRPDGRDRSPGLTRRQPEPEPQAGPAPGLPGRPANTLSPHSRERLSQPSGRMHPGGGPDRNTPSGGGSGAVIRHHSGGEPRAFPGTTRQNQGQRTVQPPGGQGQAPRDRSPGGGFQQTGRSSRPFAGVR